MRAHRLDLPVVHHENLIGMHDRKDFFGNDKYSGVTQLLFKTCLNFLFGLRIKR